MQSNLDSGANNGQFIARKNGADAMQAENIVEGGLIYDGDVVGIGLETSLVGQYGKLKNSGEADFGGSARYSGIFWCRSRHSGLQAGRQHWHRQGWRPRSASS